MYLQIIEDYQRVITNPTSSPEIILGLSDKVRDMLETYRREINHEIYERKQAQQLETYIARLREHEQALVVELEASRDEEMVTIGCNQNERLSILESIRSQIDQAVWPKPDHSEDVEILRADLELLASYCEKLDQRIDHQNEKIEDLSIRFRMLSDTINDLDKKLV